MAEGRDALPVRVAVVTGKGRGKDDGVGSLVRETVCAILLGAQSPLQAGASPPQTLNLTANPKPW